MQTWKDDREHLPWQDVDILNLYLGVLVFLQMCVLCSSAAHSLPGVVP